MGKYLRVKKIIITFMEKNPLHTKMLVFKTSGLLKQCSKQRYKHCFFNYFSDFFSKFYNTQTIKIFQLVNKCSRSYVFPRFNSRWQTRQFAVFTLPIIHLVYPPKFLHKHCFQFLLGFTMTYNRPKRN